MGARVVTGVVQAALEAAAEQVEPAARAGARVVVGSRVTQDEHSLRLKSCRRP